MPTTRRRTSNPSEKTSVEAAVPSPQPQRSNPTLLTKIYSAWESRHTASTPPKDPAASSDTNARDGMSIRKNNLRIGDYAISIGWMYAAVAVFGPASFFPVLGVSLAVDVTMDRMRQSGGNRFTNIYDNIATRLGAVVLAPLRFIRDVFREQP